MYLIMDRSTVQVHKVWMLDLWHSFTTHSTLVRTPQRYGSTDRDEHARRHTPAPFSGGAAPARTLCCATHPPSAPVKHQT